MATDDPSNPWSASGWNVTGQSGYHAKNGPARAAARAADAGTTVGGPRPGKNSSGNGPQRTTLLKHITAGWSPILAVVIDGDRKVLRVMGWAGGQGDQPPGTGKYLGASGFVTNIAAATDISGGGGGGGGGDAYTAVWMVGG